MGDFTAVPWLPPFRLGQRALFEGVLEVVHPPDALLPYSTLTPDPASFAFHAAALPSTMPGDDRARSWTEDTVRAAADATQALHALGDAARWCEAAAERRRWYLHAVDRGAPPPAAELVAACCAVPHAFRFLGKALPTAEAVRLLRPLGRICEVGAGFGLFARALERAGMLTVASDLATGPRTGIAFPVRPGMDAAATLALLDSQGSVPPLLIVWPQPDDGAWFAEVFNRAASGALVVMASPEYEFCAAGGLDAAAPPGTYHRAVAAPGWPALAALAERLRTEWDQLGEAPVVAADWPLVSTPLRLWRRR